MDETNKLIDLLIKERGGTRKQYLHLLNSVAKHETGGTFNPTMQQGDGKSRGIGKGLYQLEGTKNGGGITAARRARNLYRRNNIKEKYWLKKATSIDSLDASKLTPDQQNVLFLANLREHPKADFRNLWNGKETIPEFWAKYHWAGKKRDYKKRLEDFKSTYKEFNENEPIKKEIENPPTLPTFSEINSQELNEIKNIVLDPKQFWEDLKTKIKTGRTSGGWKMYNRVKAYNKYKKEQDSIVNSKLAYGGETTSYINNYNLYRGGFSSFNTGGSHEQNPYGGIPMGYNKNNKQNRVEQGEASYNFKDKGKFIFSNRIYTNGIIK